MSTLDEHLDDIAHYTRELKDKSLGLRGSPNIFSRSTSYFSGLQLDTTFDHMPNVGISIEGIRRFMDMAQQEGIAEESTGKVPETVKRWNPHGSFAKMLADQGGLHGAYPLVAKAPRRRLI